MRAVLVALLLVGAARQLHAATAPSLGPVTATSRVELRVATIVDQDAGPGGACDVAQQAGQRTPLLSWSAVGGARPRDGGGIELAGTACRCGAGSPSPGAGPVPFLTLDTSVTPIWDPGPMDPGPVPTVEVALAVLARQLAGFESDGTPRYRDLAPDRRTIRLGEGEEFLLPIALAEDGARAAAGLRNVFVRIRAGQARRQGATEYGAVLVVGAAPRSKIVVDGGAAGRTGADGTALLATVAEGWREVRVRPSAGRSVQRVVAVVRGRTVVVAPGRGDDDMERAAIAPAGTNTLGVAEFHRARDGAVMVRVPAGEFTMGNLETEGSPLPHRVSVSAFLIDVLPVTRARFMRFAAATGRLLPPWPYWGAHDDAPVAFVPWDEARAYCEWAGGRLPTEAEREKAARGTDGRKFPWGSEEPTPERGIFRREWGYAGNEIVGSRPAGVSPYGLLDAGGNMWEWCDDWHAPDYYPSSPHDDPPGPRTGRAHVVRGGSWDSRPTVLSASCRNWGFVGYREGDFGFRCAAEVPPSSRSAAR